MKKTRIIILTVFCFCGCVRAYDMLRVNRKTGRPDPNGIPVNNIFVNMDFSELPLPPEALAFIEWETRKHDLKNKFKLGSLNVSPFPSHFGDICQSIKSREYEARYDQPVGKYVTRIYSNGPERYAFRLIKYPRLIKGMAARNAINLNNFKDFLKLMDLAGYPEAGHGILLKLWKPYIDQEKRPGYAGARMYGVIRAAAFVPELARVVVPELQPFMRAEGNRKDNIAQSGGGAYWCKAAGIADLNKFNNRFTRYSLINFLVKYAGVTGHGDIAYDFAMAKVSKCRPVNMFDLLYVDCGISAQKLENILADYLNGPGNGPLFRVSHEKKPFAPACYPVIEKLLQKTMGNKSGIICYMAISPVGYKRLISINADNFFWGRDSTLELDGNSAAFHYNVKKNEKVARDAKWSAVMYKWSSLMKNSDFTGFLYHSRPRHFFEVLWENRKGMRAGNLLASGGPVIIPFLLEKISDRKPYTSIAACEYIAGMGTYAADAATAPLLAKLKKSQSYFVQGAIIRTLGEIKATSAIPEIRKFAANPERHRVVRLNAQQVLTLLTKK